MRFNRAAACPLFCDQQLKTSSSESWPHLPSADSLTGRLGETGDFLFTGLLKASNRLRLLFCFCFCFCLWVQVASEWPSNLANYHCGCGFCCISTLTSHLASGRNSDGSICPRPVSTLPPNFGFGSVAVFELISPAAASSELVDLSFSHILIARRRTPASNSRPSAVERARQTNATEYANAC